jgi:hypothetical protein
MLWPGIYGCERKKKDLVPHDDPESNRQPAYSYAVYTDFGMVTTQRMRGIGYFTDS